MSKLTFKCQSGKSKLSYEFEQDHPSLKVLLPAVFQFVSDSVLRTLSFRLSSDDIDEFNSILEDLENVLVSASYSISMKGGDDVDV